MFNYTFVSFFWCSTVAKNRGVWNNQGGGTGWWKCLQVSINGRVGIIEGINEYDKIYSYVLNCRNFSATSVKEDKNGIFLQYASNW